METINLEEGMTEEMARYFIMELFDGYTHRKKEHRLYEASTRVPEIIITTYYTYITPEFANIYKEFKNQHINFHNFRERYIYNENKLEEVHSKEEQMGLRKVYDYIEKKESFDDVNIYTLSAIHEVLYSLTPYPEFGGKYRRDEGCLLGSIVEITPPTYIVHEMNLLRSHIDELVQEGLALGRESNPQKIITYVDKCVKLKCQLIKIHPFADGNGRSVRAFINLLFRLANVPPVYIENKEKNKYRESMQQAIMDSDYTKINNFYYYKICDSILSLDVNLNKVIKEDTLKRTRKP